MNKTKITTIGMLGVLVTGIFIGSLVNEAHAEEEIHGFYGLDELFKDPNSIVRLYNSGGFSLKNYELGIAVFGHPVDKSEMFKFTVMVDGKVSRFITGMDSLTPDKVVPESTAPVISTRIEPKSSIGADITKWDIPTVTRGNTTSEPIYSIDADRIDSLKLGADFEKNFKVYEVRKNQPMEDVKISLTISRDEVVLKKFSGLSGVGGLVSIEIRDLDYPLFYPNFCYDVEIIAETGNQITVWKDDFLMKYSGAWNPNMSWIDESRWNYLPSSFTDEPRQKIFADEHCN